MAKNKKFTPLDRSLTSIVVCCKHCNWRALETHPGRAWYVYARHLKAVHGEQHASAYARRQAWQHGYSRKTDTPDNH